jgi:hypothetical protein
MKGADFRSMVSKPLVVVFFVAIVILWSTAALAKDYYVAKTGSDTNPGTLDQPFLTIQRAASVLVAGDTAYIRTGVYRETVRPANSGRVHHVSALQQRNGHDLRRGCHCVEYVERFQWEHLQDIGVNAMAAPAAQFVTFAETATGVAYANPSNQSATITFTALDSAGQALASKSLTLAPQQHGAAFLGPLIGLSSFSGSVQITSTAPIVSLSLNFEAAPVFSSLPPGELDTGTLLATGH